MSATSDLFTSAFEGFFTGDAARRSAKLKKQQEEHLEKLQAFNRNMFNREYFKDPLQRSSAMAILTNTMNQIKRGNKSLAGEQAVANASPEAINTERDTNNKALSDMANSVSSNADNLRTALLQQYEEQENNLQGQLAALKGENATNVGVAGQQIGKTAGNISDLLASNKNKDLA